MKIRIVVLSDEEASIFEKHFEGTEVEIITGDILQVARDTIVSPANSHGFLDGGIDDQYRLFFGVDFEQKLIDRIDRIGGNLPIGQALPLCTGHETIERIIFAPTMEMPEAIPAVNVFRAMKAALREAVKVKPEIRELYIPLLGTGVGQVPVEEAAAEMRKAWEVVKADNDFN